MEMRKLFVSALLTGVMISIGGTVFISTENIVAGAIFFAVGLFAVCVYGMALFTGRVGYLIGSPPSYVAKLGVIWLGNLTGCAVAGLLVRYARPAVVVRAHAMMETKLDQAPLQSLILGVACGLLMYIAVDNFKTSTNGKYLGILLCVPAFILAGFEHCVADMFYASVGGTLAQLPAIVAFIALVTLGNALGAFLIPLAKHKGNG